jgi:hypothetical protein
MDLVHLVIVFMLAAIYTISYLTLDPFYMSYLCVYVYICVCMYAMLSC